jgi:hypothetical protein
MNIRFTVMLTFLLAAQGTWAHDGEGDEPALNYTRSASLSEDIPCAPAFAHLYIVMCSASSFVRARTSRREIYKQAGGAAWETYAYKLSDEPGKLPGTRPSR